MVLAFKSFWKTSMKKVLISILILLFFSKVSLCQSEQDTLKLYRIETSDGNEYVGNILEINPVILKFKTLNIGLISIARTDIYKIVEVKQDQIKAGSVWFENLQSTRYYWAPNGFGLQKGEAYYQNMWILYNQAGYGFSNYFSIGAGLVPLFLFAGGSTPVWITPKFSIPIQKGKVNFGLGVLAATVVGEESVSFGIAYGVSTFGTRDRNVTLGAGYGYADGDWAKSPVFMLSTMLRATKKGYFMSENYVIKIEGDYLVLTMIGGRSLIRKVALDYGFVIPFHSELEQFVAIPWLGITIPIQSK